MRIVTAYRPFRPESGVHQALGGGFDWIAALKMLSVSALRSADLQVWVLTDETTDLPIQAFRYRSTETRLMLWILEAWIAYLESEDFDDDTVLMSPDMLVLDDIRRHWQPADLGILVRTDEKFAESRMPILNGVQFWRRAAKVRLAAFYRAVYARAVALPENLIRWGADTQATVELLGPFHVGYSYHYGLKVYGYDADTILRPLRAADVRRLDAGLLPKPISEPILDFRAMRKDHMARYFEAYCQGVPA